MVLIDLPELGDPLFIFAMMGSAVESGRDAAFREGAAGHVATHF